MSQRIGDAPVPFSHAEEGLTDPLRSALERALPAFLMRQRWFGGKSRMIDRVSIRDSALVPGQPSVLLILDVGFVDGGNELYFVPLVTLGAADAQACIDKYPTARVLTCEDGEGEICDASVDERFSQWLLQTAGRGTRLPFSVGSLVGSAGRSYADVRGDETQPLPAEPNTSEQSNTSVRFGDRIIMKMFRRLEAGPHPDCELTQYLSERRGNTHVPTFVGSIKYAPGGGQDITLALFQNLIGNQGDGWTWTMDELRRYFEKRATQAFPAEWRHWSRRPFFSSTAQGTKEEALDAVGPYINAATTLARRTGELHLDLATDTDLPDFRPRRMIREDLARLSLRLREHANQVFEVLKLGLSRFPDEIVHDAGLLLGRRQELIERFRALESLDLTLKLTRIHGDYHLGQVLKVKEDFVILDFEGEPARVLEERRSLQSPLKDVAGMLRSFSYAAHAGTLDFVARHPQAAGSLEPWAHLWEDCVSASFLSVYRDVVAGAGLIPDEEVALKLLLEAFLLDKALYELNYELNNRPAWARIPILGILGLSHNLV
jgi:maltose alpha-D-glucosyltransferase / alpha-amylase